MLVLSRKAGESIYIDRQIKVSIVSVSGGRVKVGIEAPTEIPIVRSELYHLRERSEHRSAELDSDASRGPKMAASSSDWCTLDQFAPSGWAAGI